MRYRRFGRTELKMPVFSTGGMRYQHKWQDIVPDEVPSEGQANLEATIFRALELGINHIETARGYGSSEMQLGWVLPKIPRESLILQTKIGPCESAAEFLANFETSLKYLNVEYLDLLSFHGINNAELLDWTLRPGGCLEAARKLQREGRVRFIGFATHGPTSIQVRAVETGEFDYINLHWYFVNDFNWPAIVAANAQDMGVFIISPSDKGGKLYAPPEKLVRLCEPLNPMQFNDLYCLSRPQVTTLSIGAARPTDYDTHIAALEHYDDIAATIAPIEARIRTEMERVLGAEWMRDWTQGIPEADALPDGVNVLEILRLWNLANGLEMDDFARGRYNLLGNAGHWQQGINAADLEAARLAPALAASPFADRIPGLLREAHERLAGDAIQRQSVTEKA